MTDQEYANELEKIADAYYAEELSTHEWRTAIADLRDRRNEQRSEQADKIPL